MKIGIYTRVSTEEQSENFSLDAQKERCNAWAIAKGWDCVDVYSDSASGKSLNRPKYNEMIKALESNLIQGIIVFKLDRLSRNPVDTYSIIQTFNEKKWALCSVSESLDVSSPSGIMLIQVLASFAQYERSTIKARMTLGFDQKRKDGGKVGGDESSVFGYARNDRGEIVINDDEAKIVRRIFYLKDSGKSLRAIADILSNEGAIQRKGYKGWSHVQIKRQLDKENLYRGIEEYRGGGGFFYPAIL